MRAPCRCDFQGHRVATRRAEGGGGGRRRHDDESGDESGFRVHGSGQPVDGYGQDPVRTRAGGAYRSRPVRASHSEGARYFAAGCHIRQGRRARRPERYRLDTAGRLCLGVRPDRTVAQHRGGTQRRHRAQPGRICGGPGGRRVRVGGRSAVCGKTRRPALVNARVGHDGGGVCSAGYSAGGG